jgi:GntR family transcriptional regulator/MocR family aminotransferase
MRRASHLLSLPAGPGYLYDRLYERIRSLILNGSWPPGTRLPSSRALAQDLGISRNTAILAIDKLIAEGWISARIGSGIYVAEDAPPARPLPPVGAPPPAHGHEGRAPIPFELAQAGVDLFPVALWGRLQAEIWSEAPAQALYEGFGAGWEPLRRAVAAYLHAVRGLECTPDQVIILPSSQSAIDLCVRTLSEPGDRIWVEDPGYSRARRAFGAHDLEQILVPVDEDGVRVDEGIAAAPRARLAYLTPACQFPACAILSEERRQRVLAWARDVDAFLIEDDWDHDARFDGGHPPEPLASRDGERVLFIHSFNRLLFPALRIAALVVPRHLAGRMIEARGAIDGFTTVSNQIALTHFLERGHMFDHLRRCRAAFAERRSVLIQAIERRLPDLVSIDPARPGLHLVARLAGDAAALAARARREGIACLALGDFSERPAPPALLLGFAAHPPDALEAAVARLADTARAG